MIGYMTVWSVTPALHTPLMSVTNAISGVIVIACMVNLSQADNNREHFFAFFSFMSFIGLFFAAINIFGGFFVT